jgi:hypothetical protein
MEKEFLDWPKLHKAGTLSAVAQSVERVSE